MVENIQELIAKFKSLTYIGVDDNRLVTEEGYKISYRTNFLGDPPHASDYPVQIIIHVYKGDRHVFSWHCDDNQSNRLFVNFFIVAESQAYKAGMKLRDKFQEDAEKEFFNL